jgi:uncharacterized protein YbaA (DUF1428 family)
MRDREHDQEDEQRRRRAGNAGPTPGKHALTDGMVGPTGPLDSGLGGTISRDATGEGGLDTTSTSLIESAQASPSHGLPGDLKSELEESLGTDLSGVRVHTGSSSAQAASAISASAYTLGSDVHFGDNRYQPETSGGRSLIAHEVAHVVQSGGHEPGSELALSSPGDAHEVEAHAFGHAFASGAPTSKPSAHASGVGRSIISRGGPDDDAPVTPTQGPKASGSVGVKLSSKGVSLSPSGTISHTVKGACLEATAALTITGTGKLSWPDVMPSGGPSVDTGGKTDKSAGGAGGESKKGVDVGIEKEIPLYEKKAQDKAAEESEHKDWLDGLEVEKVELVPGIGGDISKDAHGKREASIAGSIKVKATLKNKTEIVGGATIINIKSDPPGIDGPSLNASVTLPPLQKNWDLGSGFKIEGSISATASVTVKPDWAALAKEAGKLLLEAGAEGAIEIAANLAIVAAPILCMVSAISMIEDETKLFIWLCQEAHDARDASIALAGGMTGAGDFPRNERSAKAYAAGKAAADQAMASTKTDPQAFALAWKNAGGRRDAVISSCFNQARMTYDSAVEARAREVYNNSWSEKFWKTEADFVGKWRTEAGRAWTRP